MSEQPAVIDQLRERLQQRGWTLDPTVTGADGSVSRIGGPLHIEGDGWNASGSYSWPHPPSLIGPGSNEMLARVSVCKGRGHGGLVLLRECLTDRQPFKKEPMSHEKWLELALELFDRAIHKRPR